MRAPLSTFRSSRRPQLPKHWVVTGYVLDRRGERVLLLRHRKLGKWLPPGGHVEAREDPLQALLREVREETGFRVRPLAQDGGGGEEGVLPLPHPHHVQVEAIDGKHEHIDLVYVCRVVGGRLRRNREATGLRWFRVEELARQGVPWNVRFHATSLLKAGRPPPVEEGRTGSLRTSSTRPPRRISR